MEQRPLRRRHPGRRIAVVVLVLALVAGTFIAWPRWRESPPARVAAIPGAAVRAPDSVRIRVEVLNATKVRGLGRRATRWLRDGGFDVVYTGTSREQRDSTLVIDRGGHLQWARLVAARLGGARVETRPDSSRYLDVTVLLGSTFRAPPQTLYP